LTDALTAHGYAIPSPLLGPGGDGVGPEGVEEVDGAEADGAELEEELST
jgi:hypothetical protein